MNCILIVIDSLWNKNEEKFVYNMEEKEKDLLDVFKRGAYKFEK